MIIRKANLDDAAEIAKVHVDSWRTTYKNIIPDNFLRNLSCDQRTELWKKNLSKTDNHVLVAENSAGQIIGFAVARKRKTNTTLNSCDITSLYILEEYQRQGTGKMLLNELFVYFRKMAFDQLFVEVLAENKTRYFYEYYGARLVETKDITIGGTVLKEAVYKWDTPDDVIAKI